jgi:hypothetical protein
MPQYIHAFVPGGKFFFTVTLMERCGKLMMLKAGCATLSRPTALNVHPHVPFVQSGGVSSGSLPNYLISIINLSTVFFLAPARRFGLR